MKIKNALITSGLTALLLANGCQGSSSRTSTPSQTNAPIATNALVQPTPSRQITYASHQDSIGPISAYAGQTNFNIGVTALTKNMPAPLKSLPDYMAGWIVVTNKLFPTEGGLEFALMSHHDISTSFTNYLSRTNQANISGMVYIGEQIKNATTGKPVTGIKMVDKEGNPIQAKREFTGSTTNHYPLNMATNIQYTLPKSASDSYPIAGRNFAIVNTESAKRANDLIHPNYFIEEPYNHFDNFNNLSIKSEPSRVWQFNAISAKDYELRANRAVQGTNSAPVAGGFTN